MKMKTNNAKKVRQFILLLFLGLILIVLTACNDKNSANTLVKNNDTKENNWYLRMADSEIFRKGDSLEYGKSDPGAKWNYQTGLFLKSLLDIWKTTGDKKYFDYSKKIIDSFLEPDGKIKTYNMEEYNIDKINSGKVLLSLFKETNDPEYKKASGLLYYQLQNHPRTKEGGFWHKQRYPWQMWLDGIYMGCPFYAEYSKMFDIPEGFDDVANQILVIDVHTRDPKTKLRYHAWDESNKQEWANPETGCSPNFWGRAMGWYAMALIDVLDYLPEDHPKRDKIVFILKDFYNALVDYQDKENGLWYQVVDMSDRKGNYPEASASSMFVYAFAKAINNNILDSSYKQVAEKGYNGIINNLIKVDDNGLVSLTNICSVAGLGGDPYRDGSFEYYISEPVVSNDLKGVAPFIMAGIQMEKLRQNN